VARYKAFGKEIDRRFGKPMVSGSGQGNVLEIDLKKPAMVNCAVISEDISKGQRVRKFVIEGFSSGQWTTIKEGSSLGSKRIEEFPPVRISKVRLRITDAIATPVIQNLALFNIGQLDESKITNHQENISKTLGGWDNKTFSTNWQDFSLDLTPYLVEKVGQFELKFQMITHDRKFEKAGTGGYGLEFKDWKIEMYGADNPDAMKTIGDGIFLINNSQYITKGTVAKVIFKTQIRARPGGSVGTIELKMIGFE
jgi:alpha-L-fucosidase